MSHEKPAGDRPLTTALAEAAGMAGHAPSVHNTQPWHWTVLPDALELRLVRERHLSVLDPEGRLLFVSCGAALHHARVALAAEGWTPVVERLPDPAQPDLLARLTGLKHTGSDPEAMRLVQCIRVRHTDRRPVSDEPISAAALNEIDRAATAEGVNLQILDDSQKIELAGAAQQAAAVEADSPELREELAYWINQGGAGTGLPPEVLPAEAPQTTVPTRDFGHPGSLPVGAGHDRAAVYGILWGTEDEPDSWLRAGEGLSAAWLAATRLGASLVPLSGVVEVDGTRQTLRRMLSGLGFPYISMRLGLADPTHAGPAHTPRLDVAQTVDTSAVRGQLG
ncbi:Acg family FMN-binding oxidoreductase [Micromonospora sp. NPDC049836]|uniref:Acg family FMN-binding oxidoreductase n=1 Tax=Micromonospora sp. NPDC049836 TaxID=3364274 RepID=UPI00379D919A